MSTARRVKPNQIPDELLHNAVLNQRIESGLPSNYNFEIAKTIWRIRKANAQRVCLQFPDGLFIFAIPIVTILKEFCTTTEFLVMADTVYGACCIDDTKAAELGCDMLVHYGHSCLVPINQMAKGVSVLYIFVDIKFDIYHFIQTIVTNFGTNNPNLGKIYLAGTIQFVSSIHNAAKVLREKHSLVVEIPQARPLTGGEVLGCTAPKLAFDVEKDLLVFVADGRFHLEAMMIANPGLPSFRYNPYNKELTREYYANDEMIVERSDAADKMKHILRANKPLGLILGTLGRQGNFNVLQRLRSMIAKCNSRSTVSTFLISEVTPELLATVGRDTIAGWVQINCPRLSIDWSKSMVDKPLLTPYELRTAIKRLEEEDAEKVKKSRYEEVRSLPDFGRDKQYHMDFYSASSLGNWTPSHKCHTQCECNIFSG